MSHPSSTPVKVPASAATYTAATLDPDLRSQINTVLLREGHIAKIQEHLLHSLDAHPSNWPSAVESHALSLLRSGEVSTFPALIRRVLEDVRHDTAAAEASAATATSSGSETMASAASIDTATKNGEVNGTSATVNGNTITTTKKTGVNGTSSSGGGGGGGGDTANNLAVPAAVIEGVLKVARESLEAVCQLEEGGGSAVTNGG
ncbi:hypothetical protein DL766_007351 [Monosporascus sp. MC13-8B]|uniref:Uncharacterized protein n=1 Tax=Monosporascus cannonballus TaxID=155416 RepID=A0ABY0H6D0_9PEZI|nr:hypothetical protein DL762_005318 [Monosporascus cannonballus]RYP24142.1 hypothetical protein DL766_007351 [Monosporascus sp. MC13-8B]